MLFNSLPFLIFLPTVVVLYYLLPKNTRWFLLLLASYFFYGFWKIEYLSLIVISTTTDYFAARLIYSSKAQVKRKLALAFSLSMNLGLLAFFKYSGWFIEDVANPVGLLGDDVSLKLMRFMSFALPVGISFYTFQTMGYTIDVYYGKATPERNPLKFALFVSYFPHLVAGPIERFNTLMPQLNREVSYDYRNIQHGARYILYGLFIKMCIADNLAPIVDQIFNQPDIASSSQLVWGMILFGLQIYSDFHGYSLIAIGVAKLMGVDLMKNFDAPYSSLSIREFWSRWHISLSTWFRDYLFIPLGGSRVSTLKLTVNIMAVFLISGLWHGANWTFVVWGALHGLAYLGERWFLSSDTKNTLSVPRWIATMAVVFIAWIFFRSDSINDATLYIARMFAWESGSLSISWDPVLISLLGLFLLSDIHFRNRDFDEWLQTKSSLQRWSVYGLLIFCTTALSGTVNHPFIYFQF